MNSPVVDAVADRVVLAELFTVPKPIPAQHSGTGTHTPKATRHVLAIATSPAFHAAVIWHCCRNEPQQPLPGHEPNS